MATAGTKELIIRVKPNETCRPCDQSSCQVCECQATECIMMDKCHATACLTAIATAYRPHTSIQCPSACHEIIVIVSLLRYIDVLSAHMKSIKLLIRTMA